MLNKSLDLYKSFYSPFFIITDLYENFQNNELILLLYVPKFGEGRIKVNIDIYANNDWEKQWHICTKIHEEFRDYFNQIWC